MKTPSPNTRFAALQYRDFRLLWFGRLLSATGSQMQQIAISWQVFELLQGQELTLTLFGRELGLDASALGLGSLGLARVIPIAIFALVGGVLADSRDRRKLMLVTLSVSTIISLILTALTYTDNITVPIIYLLSAAAAAASAFTNPAQQSLVPNLVKEEHLTNAVSLNSLLFQVGTILGPGVGGFLIAQYSVGLVYLIDAVSFTAVIIALLFMNYRGGAAMKTSGLGWEALIDGVRFTFGTKLIWSTMLLDFFATLFASARTMLPIIATEILNVGVEGYGILATAQPIGAVIAGSIMAWREDVKRQGVVMLTSVVVYGVATAVFGLSTIFWLSYILFGLTGAGDTVSMVIRGSLRQLLTPDELRGRMTSVNMVFFMGGPQLGELEAGLVAAAFGAPFAIVSGGIATVVMTLWVAWRYPSLRRYERT